MRYLKRIADEQLSLKLDAFGGALITGPKGCGKTTTAKQKAKSVVEFQNEDERENYLLIANTHPSDLLKGAKPRLFDEWQDAPKIWGAIRKDIDDTGDVGLYILTGSSSRDVEIKFAICRGGWPASLKGRTEAAKLAIARDLFSQTCDVDISKIDNTKRNPLWARTILRSYARNLCTLSETKTILADVTANFEMSKPTYYDYVSGFEKLMIIEDIGAWCPSIRSKTSIRSNNKRNFIDPSIAAAALNVSPEYFSRDYKTLGFLFESLCIRDLKVYSSANNGVISYYHDRLNLEADAVLHLEDGRYALIEIKLGQSEIDVGARHLLEIERLIIENNKNESQVPLRLPDLKMVITGTKYGYVRPDGVYVVPIGCLKD